MQTFRSMLVSCLTTSLTLALASSSVHAQDDANDVDPPDAPPAAEEMVIPGSDATEDERAPEAVQRGQAWFDALVSKMRAAPAIRDTATVRTTARYMGQTDEQNLEVPLVVSEHAASIKLETVKLVAIDGTLYGEFDDRSNRYMAVEYEEPIRAQLFTTQMTVFPFPHFALMYAEDPLEEINGIFSIEPSIVGSREIMTDDDRALNEILIESTNNGAPVTLRIDPETGLLAGFHTYTRDPSMDPGDGMFFDVSFKPELLDETPIEAFLIETEKRREVDSFAELTAGPVTADLIEQQAPGFQLTSLDDQVINLDDLSGNAVVVNFWTVPAEDLHPTLKHLHEAEAWAKTEEVPAKFVTINISDTPEDIKAYWEHFGYTFPVYKDQTGAVANAYNVIFFPVTVVIAPDTTVTAVYVADDVTSKEDFTKVLTNEIQRALSRGL